MIKKHFNENLITSAEDEKRFKSSNKCQTYNKSFAAEIIKLKIRIM